MDASRSCVSLNIVSWVVTELEVGVVLTWRMLCLRAGSVATKSGGSVQIGINAGVKLVHRVAIVRAMKDKVSIVNE